MALSTPRASLAIDFGTSNTVAVLARPGRMATPLLFDGSPVLPSAVFGLQGRLLVGRDAERAAMSDPASYEPNPKRCVGDGSILLGGAEYPVGDVVTAVFARVLDEAVRVAGGVPDQVVLTHPAEWAAERLRVLVDAAIAAGLPRPLLLPEPVAAAAHFTTQQGNRVADGGHVVVYDMGGGTFDVSAVRAQGDRVTVAATGGLDDVGGVDIDHAVVRHLEQTYPGYEAQWQRLREPSEPLDRRHRRSLWRDVRDAKEMLSRESSAALFIPVLDIDAHLTRDELENLARPLLDQTVAATLEVLHGAGIDMESVAGLFLVGGASRMPLASTMLLRRTGKAPTVLEQPEVVVALGAVGAAHIAVDAAERLAQRQMPSHPVYRGVVRLTDTPLTAPGLQPGAGPNRIAMPTQPIASPPAPVSGPPNPSRPVSGAPVSGPPGSAAPVSGAPTSGPPVGQAWGPPVSGPPVPGQPVSGAPTSGPPGAQAWGPPVSGPPVPGQPVSGAPTSGPPVARAWGPPAPAAPVSGPPGSAAPVSGAPTSGPPVPGQPVSGAPVSAAPVSGAPVSGPPAPGPAVPPGAVAPPPAKLTTLPPPAPDAVPADLPPPEGVAVATAEPAAPGPEPGEPTVTGKVGAVALRGSTIAALIGNDVVLYDMDTERETAVRSHSDVPSGVAWSPRSNGLATTAGRSVLQWPMIADDMTFGAATPQRVMDSPQPTRLVGWSSAGIAVGGDSTVRIWSPTTGECVRTWQYGGADRVNGELRAMAWSPDGGMLAAAGTAGDITIWPADGDEPVYRLNQSPVAVRSLAWAPDSDWLLSGDAGGGLRIWRLADQSCQHIGGAHEAAVCAVAWSPDGKLLASGGIDEAIRLWDAGSGRADSTLSAHMAPVTALAWTRDSRRLISGGDDGRLLVWDALDGIVNRRWSHLDD